MNHMPLTFKPFNTSAADVIRPWFEDSETSMWLGDTGWIQNIFRLQNEPPGSEYRGAKSISYHAYVVYDQSIPVGFVDAGVTDRYVKYGGEVHGEPIYLHIEDVISSSIAFVTNPEQRRKGYATEMIKLLVHQPELKQVQLFEAGVDPENIGSIHVLEKCGFTSDYERDFENMFNFFMRRSNVHHCK